MEENLTEKTKELNLILARCQSLTEDDNPSHVITSHKLHEEIRQLKQTVSQLRQQITHLQDEQVSHHQEAHLTDNDHINDNYTKSHQTTPMMDGDLNELLLVFSYLSIDDLFQVGRVCKRWREASLDPSLWQRVELSDRVIDSHGLVTIATRCSTTQHITIQGLYPLPAHPNEDLKSYIFHQKAGLERGLLMLLQTCGKNLKSLVISECNLLITERAFWIISKTCPHLSSLYYYSSEFPPTPESLWSLANGCTRLQSLSLPPTHDNELAHIFNDKCLYHITHGFPIVNKLMLGGMGMSLEGLTYLGMCRNLTHLNIVRGPQVNLKAADGLSSLFQSLTHLYFTHTNVSPKAVVRLIETHDKLQVFHLTISIRDYRDINEVDGIEKYRKIISNFETIRRHTKYGRIFEISEQDNMSINELQ